jgi:hypothetical protein
VVADHDHAETDTVAGALGADECAEGGGLEEPEEGAFAGRWFTGERDEGGGAFFEVEGKSVTVTAEGVGEGGGEVGFVADGDGAGDGLLAEGLEEFAIVSGGEGVGIADFFEAEGFLEDVGSLGRADEGAGEEELGLDEGGETGCVFAHTGATPG